MSRVVSGAAIAVAVAVIVSFAVIGSSQRDVTIQDLAAGDCFFLPEDDIGLSITSFSLAECDDVLKRASSGGGVAAYVLKVGTLDESSSQFPTAKDLLQMVDERCDEFALTVPAILPLVPDDGGMSLLEVHTHVSPYRQADVSSRHEWLVASPLLRAISSVGRAPRSHRGGHGIEARIAHSSRKCSPRCAESPTLRTWPHVIVRDVLSPWR